MLYLLQSQFYKVFRASNLDERTCKLPYLKLSMITYRAYGVCCGKGWPGYARPCQMQCHYYKRNFYRVGSCAFVVAYYKTNSFMRRQWPRKQIILLYSGAITMLHFSYIIRKQYLLYINYKTSLNVI